MAIDPESIGIFIGTVFTSAGATIGGLKVMSKLGGESEKPGVCPVHHDLAEKVTKIAEDVAYIRGVLDQKRE